MKKILLAFDGTHFSEGAFEFARRLNEEEPILLTGVFVPLVNYASLWSYASASAATGAPVIPLLEDDEIEEVQNNIERFKALCVKHNIESRIHRDYTDFALPELKKETRYADLLILGSQIFYGNIGAAEPNDYLKDMMEIAECPVLVVPEKFTFPESNILAYDGSESSVYAIRQFAYLFPGFTSNKTLLIYIDDSEKPIPDESYIKELAGRHFSDLTIAKLELLQKNIFQPGSMIKKNCCWYAARMGGRLFHKYSKEVL